MKERNPHLFKNFLRDKRIYQLNKNYWAKLIGKIVDENGLDGLANFRTEKFQNGKMLYDGNPIYNIYLPSINRAVRIIQEAPESEVLEFSHWVEKTEINDRMVNELAISLELTRAAKNLAEEILFIWMDKTKETEIAITQVNKLADLYLLADND